MDLVELFRIIPFAFFEFLDKKDSFKMVLLNKCFHSNLYDPFCNYYIFTKLSIPHKIIPNIRKLNIVLNHKNMQDFNNLISSSNLNSLELCVDCDYDIIRLSGDYKKLNLTVSSLGDILIPETVRSMNINFMNIKYKSMLYGPDQRNIMVNYDLLFPQILYIKGCINVRSLKINSNYNVSYGKILPYVEKLDINMPDIQSIPNLHNLISLRLNLNKTSQISNLLEQYKNEIQNSKLKRFDYYTYNNLNYPDIVLPISLKTLYIQMVYDRYEDIFSIGFIPWNIKKLILEFGHNNNRNNTFVINYLPPNIEKLKIINNERVKKIIINSCPIQLRYLKLTCNNVSITDRYTDKVYNCGILSKCINLEYLVIDKITTEIQMDLLPKTIKKMKLEDQISYHNNLQVGDYTDSFQNLDYLEMDDIYP